MSLGFIDCEIKKSFQAVGVAAAIQIEECNVSGSLRIAYSLSPVILLGVAIDGGLQIYNSQLTQVHFDRCQFDGGVNISQIAREAVFRDAVIGKSANIQGRRASVLFDHTEFRSGGQLNFLDSKVELKTTKANAQLSIFGSTEKNVQTEIHSIDQADVGNMSFSNVDMSGCIFYGSVGLHQTTLEPSVRLATTPRHYLYRRACVADEATYRIGRGGSAAWGWASVRSSRPQIDEAETGQERAPLQLTAGQVSGVYRALRRSFESDGNHLRSMEFYYGEMEMKRLDNQFPLLDRVIIFIYWILSGYGQSPWRALFWTLLIALASAIGFQKFGLAQPTNFPTAMLTALQSMIPGARGDTALNAFGQYVKVFLNVIGPVMIGLTFFAIRSRLKR